MLKTIMNPLKKILMKRTEILCPECMKKKLLEEVGNPIDLHCDGCGTEFTLVAPNTVEYK